MSFIKRIEITEPYHSPPRLIKETNIFSSRALAFPSFFDECHDFGFPLDLLNPSPIPFEVLDTVADLIQIEKSPSFFSYKRIQHRVGADFTLQSLCDRVALLESSFDRLVNARVYGGERKYTWTAEIKGPVERKYKWTAEIKEEKKKKEEEGVERNYKWKAEIKGDGPISRTYKIEASSGGIAEYGKSEKKDKKHKMEKTEKKKKNKGESGSHRVVEIEETPDHGAFVLRQAFAKRAGAIRMGRGKQQELSPQDAALMIQMTFRAYLIRRSQALRALRDLAVAKTKLKEIRALFNNFSYRRRIACDAEERQRFSERIIVVLLTVDAIEGADLMVRTAKRSMVDELEAMLDAVDPQTPGKSLSLRRMTFDMPDGVFQKEIAKGVAQVVQLLDQEENGTKTLEDVYI
ncbi:hypothetical protein CFOL_v3_31326 [Cephalotus follicularis]|uniref:BAG domain-containing protein n=1 Tax=Cephalotus follicularis TaxID=3775 RepID=A0A1Q3D624_CEPFO|nr:hypothetical protein CFOL_v3_31326 [Cephalotus follicularis]